MVGICRYYTKGSPVPLAVSDPIISRWPTVQVECAQASITCGRPLIVNYACDAAHDHLAHTIELCFVKEDARGGSIASITPLDAAVVPAGHSHGEVSFQGAHIVPGRYLVEYRMSEEFGRLKLASR